MDEFVSKQVKVINAKYVEDTKSILILGECILEDGKTGRLTHQIHRSLFSYGDRTEKEIVKELKKTAELLKDKTITMEFDPSLQDGSENPLVKGLDISR